MDKKLDAFSVGPRNQLRLMRQRGAYDKETVYRILDSALFCNVGYVIDGQPYVTPTAFWREQNYLYWHGSSASRALVAQSEGIPVCLTVTHVDGLVIARSGFHSSVNYRSVMAFGVASVVEDEDHKRRAMNTYMDRFTPGRTAANRVATSKELKATKLLSMDIEDASAKVRIGQPVDDQEDYDLPIWAGVINFKTVVTDIVPDPKNLSSVLVPPGVAAYEAGQPLDEILRAIYHADSVSSHD